MESQPGDLDAWQREEAGGVADSTVSCLRRLKTKFEASPAVQRDVLLAAAAAVDALPQAERYQRGRHALILLRPNRAHARLIPLT